MARVTIIAVKAGTLVEGLVRGKPNGVAKLDTVNASFNAAGSPDYDVPANTEALIFITDTAIDFVVVRAGNAPGSEVAQPIPLAANGLSQYTMFVEDADDEVFIRTMA